MVSNKTTEKKVLNGKRFLAIFFAGIILGVIFLIVFNILTTDVTVILDFSSFDNWYQYIQDRQTTFWLTLFPTSSEFFNHLAANSLAYMCGLLLIIIIIIAFVLSYKKQKKGKK